MRLRARTRLRGATWRIEVSAALRPSESWQSSSAVGKHWSVPTGRLSGKEEAAYVTHVADVHHRILCCELLSFGRIKSPLRSLTLAWLEGRMIIIPEIVPLPSLIVGACGESTGLATQGQCLEMLGCYGQGKVKKVGRDLCGRGFGGRSLPGCSAGEW
jgi:hypothetical protein